MNIYLNKSVSGWAWRITYTDSEGVSLIDPSWVAFQAGKSKSLCDAIGSAAIQLHNVYVQASRLGSIEGGERVFIAAEDATEAGRSSPRRAHMWVESPMAMYGLGTEPEIVGAAEEVEATLSSRLAA